MHTRLINLTTKRVFLDLHQGSEHSNHREQDSLDPYRVAAVWPVEFLKFGKQKVASNLEPPSNRLRH